MGKDVPKPLHVGMTREKKENHMEKKTEKTVEAGILQGFARTKTVAQRVHVPT